VVAALVGGVLSGLSALVIGHIRVRGKVGVLEAEMKEAVDRLEKIEERMARNEERLDAKLDTILEKIEFLGRAMNAQFLGCPNHRTGKGAP
jgi:tetrahydromethanopterin S-methyltransferase subunit G